MVTNCSITVYNKYTDKTTQKDMYKKTIIKKANWQGSKVTSISASGTTQGVLQSVKTTNIFVPFINDFSNKTYIEPKAWLLLADADRDKYFTFQELDYAVKGECDYEFNSATNPITNLTKKYDDVVSVMTVVTNDNGSSRMHHYMLGGK